MRAARVGSGKQASHILSCQDVYEWEAKGSGSCDSEAQNGGCLYLILSGKSKDASFFADAGESGDDVFIFTTAQLVGQDEDSLVDVYDARVGGGLAGQNQPAPAECDGEASCRPGAVAAPENAGPGTAGFSGPGNPQLHRPICPRGKHLVGGRHGKKKHCGRGRRHKHRRHHARGKRRHRRYAKTTGRAGR